MSLSTDLFSRPYQCISYFLFQIILIYFACVLWVECHTHTRVPQLIQDKGQLGVSSLCRVGPEDGADKLSGRYLCSLSHSQACLFQQNLQFLVTKFESKSGRF